MRASIDRLCGAVLGKTRKHIDAGCDCGEEAREWKGTSWKATGQRSHSGMESYKRTYFNQVKRRSSGELRGTASKVKMQIPQVQAHPRKACMHAWRKVSACVVYRCCLAIETTRSIDSAHGRHLCVLPGKSLSEARAFKEEKTSSSI